MAARRPDGARTGQPPDAHPQRSHGRNQGTPPGVLDDLIDLVLRLEPAARASMPRLATDLALSPLPAQQLLSLRPRFRPPLLPGLRRIARRRLRTRSRVPPRLLLQPPQPLLQPRYLRVIPRGQLQQELNASLPPRVIDHLGLGAIHNPKIRHPHPRTSSRNPTTERLPKLIGIGR